MCNLTRITKRKSVICYKVVYFKDGRYFSPFYDVLIDNGDVLDDEDGYNFYIGRVSGFKTLKAARILIDALKNYSMWPHKWDNLDLRILKIKLSDSIAAGTGRDVADSKYGLDQEIVYAGKHVEILTEVS